MIGLGQDTFDRLSKKLGRGIKKRCNYGDERFFLVHDLSSYAPPNRPCLSPQPAAYDIIDPGGHEDQEDVLRFPAHVKEVAGGEQQPTKAVRQQKVQPDHDRKKQGEFDRIK